MFHIGKHHHTAPLSPAGKLVKAAVKHEVDVHKPLVKHALLADKRRVLDGHKHLLAAAGFEKKIVEKQVEDIRQENPRGFARLRMFVSRFGRKNLKLAQKHPEVRHHFMIQDFLQQRLKAFRAKQ